ncbi:hypothetical protein [Arthrobacter sp. 24S4-2]
MSLVLQNPSKVSEKRRKAVQRGRDHPRQQPDKKHRTGH